MVGMRSSARLRACSWRAAVPSARCLAWPTMSQNEPVTDDRRIPASHNAKGVEHDGLIAPSCHHSVRCASAWA
jgi:hypothetical protein